MNNLCKIVSLLCRMFAKKSDILVNVQRKRAGVNTKYHCLYGHYFLGLSRSQLAKLYRKSKSTISCWIDAYEDGSIMAKRAKAAARKFDVYKRNWIIQQYRDKPVMFLDEARQRFSLKFGTTISASSVCNILHAYGLTWKKLERRAINIKEHDILRFTRELSVFKWDLNQLLFLDETAFLNKEMLRDRGYGLVGSSLIYTGEFNRQPRISCLSFLGQTGIVENFETEGTFNRIKYFDCVRKMALYNKDIRAYPGRYSVWIMDGAKIHCDQFIIKYLRSLGIIPIFLPAYCPMYNPIEVIFGLIKRYLKRTYVENSKTALNVTVDSAIARFTNYDCTNIFRKCGYKAGGIFDHALNLC